MVHPDIIRVILGDNDECQIPMESKFRFHGALSGLELGFDSTIHGECKLPDNTIVNLERAGQNFTVVWNSHLKVCTVSNSTMDKLDLEEI